MDPKASPRTQTTYHIHLEGQLDSNWSNWFGDLSITQQQDGNTLLTCTLPDQAALHGLLRKIRDLGLPIISLTRVDSE